MRAARDPMPGGAVPARGRDAGGDAAPGGPARIVAQRLRRCYGPVTALDGIDVSLGAGIVVALIGANGAGKTSLLMVCATLLRPTGGSVRICGDDVVGAAAAVRRRIGFVGHRPLLYPDLTAEENLRFWARLAGVGLSHERLRSVIAAAGLWRRRHDRVRELSRGMTQRLDIARAMLHEPSVLLLDEPHSGLDPASADALDDALARLAAHGRTVLWATHDLARAEALADHFVVLHQGRLLWSGPRADVPGGRIAQWQPVIAGAAPDARAALLGAAGHGAPAGREVASAEARRAPPAPDAAGAIMDAAASRASLGEVVRALVEKDVRTELRAREAVPPVVLFALLVVTVLQFALPAEPSVRLAAAPGALWIALLFGATLGLARLAAAESESGGRTGLRLAPVDRGALFVGKWASGCVFVAMVTAVLLPAFAALLGLRLSLAQILALAGVIALGMVGWVASGVLVSTLAVGTRAREVLLPVLLYPLVLPLVVPAVRLGAALLGLSDASGVGAHLVLLVAYDIVYWTAGLLLFAFALEE